MSKEQVYKQIDSFITKVKDEKETKTNKYYFVDSEEANRKSNFINFLITNKNNTLLAKKIAQVDTVLDLAFGSGNLTSHILLNNGIKYNKLILNDKFIEDCNKSLKTDLDNCELKQCDFFDSNCFDENSVDLLIFNPTHGGKPVKKDFVCKANKNFEALNITLKKVLKPDALVIFKGAKEDFDSLFFSQFKYQNILIDEDFLYVVYDVDTELKKCYEFKENKFIENKKCKKEQKNPNEDLSIETLIKDMNDIDIEDKSKKGLFLSSKEPKVEEEPMKEEKNKIDNKILGNLDFPHKNILLKGVPGTGKSKTIDNIIEKNLDMSEIPENVLRINIHSASSNSDLMQGISISTNDNNDILYAEKRGAVLKHIFKAMYKPNQPFVLVLEEIQENSLNELIGDLIYLIEKDKRTEIKLEDEQELSYDELFNKVKPTHFVELPNLVENSASNTKMIMPDNLYVFCTSNYRDDRKVIEDNLLRRFDVVEIYPQYQDKLGEDIFKSKDVSDFLAKLNSAILKQFGNETHPDRYLVGHANWLNITEDKNYEDKKLFYIALLKVIIEFKEIREVDFNAYVKPILQKLFKKDDELSDRIEDYLEIFYDNNELKLDSYKSLVEKLQTKIYSDFL